MFLINPTTHSLIKNFKFIPFNIKFNSKPNINNPRIPTFINLNKNLNSKKNSLKNHQMASIRTRCPPSLFPFLTFFTSFEKELRYKLSQKATPHQGEENILLKSFKYFDLNNSGAVDREEFLKTVEKIGIQIFNKQVQIFLLICFIKQFLGLL